MKWFHHAIVPSFIIVLIVALQLPVSIWAICAKYWHAFLYLDPSYVPYEDPANDWAIATFATLGVLLALVVPKIIDFDRDIIKQMGLPTFTGTHPRSFLYCLKRTNSTKHKKLFESILDVNVFYGLLCVSLFVFIFIPPFRGVLAGLVFIYSWFLLHSIQFMTQEEELEALLLNNIQDKDVSALLDKYIEEVYSTQKHPRQEAFYISAFDKYRGSLLDDQIDCFEDYNELLEGIYDHLNRSKTTINPSFLNRISHYSVFPFGAAGNAGIAKHILQTDKLQKCLKNFERVLFLCKHHPELKSLIMNDLIPYDTHNLLSSEHLIDKGRNFPWDSLFSQSLLRQFNFSEDAYNLEKVSSDFIFTEDLMYMSLNLIGFQYLFQFIKMLLYSNSKEELIKFKNTLSDSDIGTRTGTWIRGIDHSDLLCRLILTSYATFLTPRYRGEFGFKGYFTEKGSSDDGLLTDGLDITLILLFHHMDMQGLKTWLFQIVFEGLPYLRNLFIEDSLFTIRRLDPYTRESEYINDAFLKEFLDLTDEDIVEIKAKIGTFKTQIEKIFIEKGWSHT